MAISSAFHPNHDPEYQRARVIEEEVMVITLLLMMMLLLKDPW